MVESANKTIRSHFRKWSTPDPRVGPWHRYLPYVERIMCDSRIPGLRHTPNDMVLGRAVAHSARLNLSADEYVRELSASTGAILDDHYCSLQARQANIDEVNRTIPDTSLEPGMLVLIF